MLESTMAAAAGGAGGVLGQLGNVLSAPRRFAWDAMGLPEDGASLLNQTFGMDRESPWTKILGMGAEAVLDPLTYAGMLLGGPLAKMGAGALNARKAAPLAEELAGLTATRRAAQEGLVARAGMEAQTTARYADQAHTLEALDLPGIAGGRTKTYNSFTNPLAEDMTNAGMGSLSADGSQLHTLGQGTPRGVEMNQLQLGAKGRRYGSVMDHAGEFAEPSLPAPGVPRPNLYANMDPLLPDQLAWLQAKSKEQLGNRWRQLGNDAAPYNSSHLSNDFASAMAADANATRPMPSLGTYLRDQMLPTSHLTPEILGKGLPDAYSASHAAVLEAMARKKALDQSGLATAITRGDYAKMAGGSYLATLGFGSGDR